MNLDYLDFEQPIVELEEKLDELRRVGSDNEIDIQKEIDRLQEKSLSLTETTFSKLSDWQISKLSRHPKRPYTLDYIDGVVDGFIELHGDRHYADDAAIVGGIGQPLGAILGGYIVAFSEVTATYAFKKFLRYLGPEG
ncbi:MAG: acetyl-CoA carboxylase carboxyl transferase subunit alpha, partial [Cycloclasticus sp.]